MDQYSFHKSCPTHVTIPLLVSGSEPKFKILFHSPFGTPWYITVLSAGMNCRLTRGGYFLAPIKGCSDAVGMNGAIEVASTEELECFILSSVLWMVVTLAVPKSPTMMQILFPTRCLVSCKTLLPDWSEERNCYFLTLSPVLSNWVEIYFCSSSFTEYEIVPKELWCNLFYVLILYLEMQDLSRNLWEAGAIISPSFQQIYSLWCFKSLWRKLNFMSPWIKCKINFRHGPGSVDICEI